MPAIRLATAAAILFAAPQARAVTAGFQTVNGIAANVWRWTDSAGHPRTVAIKREGNGNAGHGGYAIQFTYVANGHTVSGASTIWIAGCLFAVSFCAMAWPRRETVGRGMPADILQYQEHALLCREAQEHHEGKTPDKQAAPACEGLAAEAARLREKYPRVPDFLLNRKPYWLQMLSGAEQAAADFRAAHPNKPGWSSAMLDQDKGNAANAPEALALIGNEIFFSAPPGDAGQITHDGRAKSKIVISPDGARIAFLEPPDRPGPLAQLVVIDTSGREIRRIAVDPPDRLIPQLPRSIMNTPAPLAWKAIGRLAWVSGDRIDLESDSEYNTPSAHALMSISTGKIVTQFVDTASIAAFSPDGMHYAYRSDMPLGYLCECVPYPKTDPPTLATDDGSVQLPKGFIFGFSKLAWSQDGQTLFIAVLDKQWKDHIVAWSRHKAMVLDLPPMSKLEDFLVAGDDLLVAGFPKTDDRHGMNFWRLPGARPPAVQVTSDDSGFRQPREAKQHGEWLDESISQTNQNAKSVDFWCKECDLSTLPRASADAR